MKTLEDFGILYPITRKEDDAEKFRKEFFVKVLERHEMGERKFGDTWKIENGKKWIDEASQELYDAANYLSYLYVKLQKIQNKIEQNGQQ